MAMAVGWSTRRMCVRSTPPSASSAMACAPKASLPMAQTRRTSEPARRAASAWFAPLAPGAEAKVPPSTVSPGPGRRGTVPVRSSPIEPNTVIICSPGQLSVPTRHSSNCRSVTRGCDVSGSGRLDDGVPVAAGPQDRLAEGLADQGCARAVAAIRLSVGFVENLAVGHLHHLEIAGNAAWQGQQMRLGLGQQGDIELEIVVLALLAERPGGHQCLQLFAAAQHRADGKAEGLLQPGLDAGGKAGVISDGGGERHIAAGQQGSYLGEPQPGEDALQIGAMDGAPAKIDAAQEGDEAGHFAGFALPLGWMVSPRASMSTKPAIFFARPAGVLPLPMRKARANWFCRFSVAKVACAAGLAAMAASRSGGICMSRPAA